MRRTFVSDDCGYAFTVLIIDTNSVVDDTLGALLNNFLSLITENYFEYLPDSFERCIGSFRM